MHSDLGALDPAHGSSWHAPPPPVTAQLDLRLLPSLSDDHSVATEWKEPLQLTTHAVNFSGPVPRAIAIPIGRPAIRTQSFRFAPSAQLETAVPAADVPPTKSQHTAAVPAGSTTRIHPPRDIIKLHDRLQYLLQPSLESLLAERSLEFPFDPFPFQYEGVAFLYPRHAAVLADEMGLGKTMQAITAIRLLLRRGEIQSVLLVCPKPLVTNWQREFGLWAPEIPLLVIEGDPAKRCWQWHLPDAPVRIANYELLCRDRAFLEQCDQQGRPMVQFDLVALDESQRIKNRTSTTSRIVRSIARRRSWALTGTPVENSVEDLVGIFEFLSPGFLSSEMKPRAMGRAVSDYVLRRTKDKVLKDLPPKLFREADMDLTAEQYESYRLAEDEGIIRLTEMGGEASIRHVFELVLRLKQICNFDPVTGASSKLDRMAVELDEIARSGRKAIVFSQWVETLTRLARRLHRFGPLQYHGKIPMGKRDAIIRQFRDDDSKHVMLMSYGAGGVGLNLQFAGYVFLFDRWWNPAVEDQAINRAHRIGATGPVTVTRFLILQTIEERIDRILQQKRELFDTIFDGAQSKQSSSLTQQELFGLFNIESPSGPIDLAA